MLRLGRCVLQLTNNCRNRAGLNDWVYKREHPEEKAGGRE